MTREEFDAAAAAGPALASLDTLVRSADDGSLAAVPCHQAFAAQHAPGVDILMREKSVVPPDLQAELDKLDGLGIPRDVVFEQGWSVLTGG